MLFCDLLAVAVTLSSHNADGRSRLLVSNRRLDQHSSISRSGCCWTPEELGTGWAPPADSSEHPPALRSSELPCSCHSCAAGAGGYLLGIASGSKRNSLYRVYRRTTFSHCNNVCVARSCVLSLDGRLLVIHC